jgi:Flp pilus assembly protein TadD
LPNLRASRYYVTIMNSFSKFLFCASLVVGLLIGASVRAQEDRYVQIYNQIQEGDALLSDQPLQALNKYLKAQSDLQGFQKIYPEWNPRIVTFRLNYLGSKISDLSKSASKAPASAPATTAPAKTPAQSPTPAQAAAQPSAQQNEIQNQLNALRDQIHQLQSDNALLQAKVREAFAAQPAAVDPRELEKAGDKIKSLQKENDLLKTSLTQEKSAKSSSDPREVERLKQQLADANNAVSEQSSRANALIQEKLELQNKLLALNSAPNSAETESLKKALQESSAKLNEQLKFNALLQTEKTSLQKRVAELSADAETTAALRAENVLLKKQVTELRLSGASTETARKLAEAQAQIAALQSDREVLRVEKNNLQQQVRQLTLANVTLTRSTDVAHVKQLERDRDELQGRLTVAENDLATRRNKAVSAQLDDLRSQVNVLQTRLAVYQAPAVPFTKEELALFSSKPEQMTISVNPGFEKKSAKELPSGTISLVNDAQRDFALGRYAEAEKKYLQVLKLDDKNVYTIANLAAIQLELNRLDEAEKHIKQALAISPDDSYSLSILGNLKMRQGKTDDALDALAHAVKIEPKNAEIQNQLGLVLSQKGLRKEAETALRTAIELDPNYAAAHNNLAVIYITQKPPSPALARWHYEKARALGLGSNAQLEKMLEQAAVTASASTQPAGNTQ